MVVTQKAFFARTVSAFLEAGYRLGATGENKDYDCFSFLYCFYKALGAELPSSMDSYTLENYAEKYEQDPEKAKHMMQIFFSNLGEDVPTQYMIDGDLIILDGTVFLIYIGRGNFIGVHIPAGVIVVPQGSLKYSSIKVRRILCHRQSP